MKYIKVEWPEIQDYWLYGQNNIVDYDSYYYFDPVKNCWFVPEDWDNKIVVDLEELEYEILIEEYG